MKRRSERGKSYQDYLSDLQNAWRHPAEYKAAIQKARQGHPSDLVNLLRGHVPLDASAFCALARFAEDHAGMPPQRPRNEGAYEAARVFYQLREIELEQTGRARLALGRQEGLIKRACEIAQLDFIDSIEFESVLKIIRDNRSH